MYYANLLIRQSMTNILPQNFPDLVLTNLCRIFDYLCMRRYAAADYIICDNMRRYAAADYIIYTNMRRYAAYLIAIINISYTPYHYTLSAKI